MQTRTADRVPARRCRCHRTHAARDRGDRHRRPTRGSRCSTAYSPSTRVDSRRARPWDAGVDRRGPRGRAGRAARVRRGDRVAEAAAARRLPQRPETVPPPAAPLSSNPPAPPEPKPPTGFVESTSTEVPSARKLLERTWLNADGTRTTQFSAEALNYVAPDGSLQPVDNTLVVGADGVVRNAANSWQVEFGSVAAGGSRSTPATPTSGRAQWRRTLPRRGTRRLVGALPERVAGCRRGVPRASRRITETFELDPRTPRPGSRLTCGAPDSSMTDMADGV